MDNLDWNPIIYQFVKLDFRLEFLGLLMNRSYFVNLLFGLTFLNLTVVGMFSLTCSFTFFSMVRLSIVMCNFVMGLMLICNKNSILVSSPLYRPYWLLMIVCNIVVVKLIDELHPLVGIASVVFIIGATILLLSLCSLRGSFAVIPMVSPIKTNFLYRLVRHPMYLGESLMLLACTIASNTGISFIVFIAYLATMILRVKEEEKLLSLNTKYESYCLKVTWRLLPHIW